MQLTVPSNFHRTAICTSIAKTHPNRRAWIEEDSPFAGEILDEYPRLLDYDGAIVSFVLILTFQLCQMNFFLTILSFQIDLEFSLMTSDETGGAFLRSFGTTYTPRILKYISIQRPDLVTRFQQENIEDGKVPSIFVK